MKYNLRSHCRTESRIWNKPRQVLLNAIGYIISSGGLCYRNMPVKFLGSVSLQRKKLNSDQRTNLTICD